MINQSYMERVNELRRRNGMAPAFPTRPGLIDPIDADIVDPTEVAAWIVEQGRRARDPDRKPKETTVSEPAALSPVVRALVEASDRLRARGGVRE